MSELRNTTISRAERRVIDTVMRRYRVWAQTFQKCHDEIVAGSNRVGGGKNSGDMIRACAAFEKMLAKNLAKGTRQ